MFDLGKLGAWQDLPFFETDLPAITAKLQDEDFLPPADLTFAALTRTQPEQVKVVVIGQDPYHTEGKADGLAFSIPDGFGGRLDSLGNIFKELQSDLGIIRTKTSLDDWADQGVLLLNTALTVRSGDANSHAKLGWSALVPQVIEKLSKVPRIYILWGDKAQKYTDYIGSENSILSSSHPSPFAARKGFFGSRPFSTVNQWLIEQGNTPIDWADPQ